MQPKEVFPTSTEIRKDPQYWNPKTLTYRGQKRYFNQNIRTGKCYFCRKYGRTQNYHKKTYLHHLDYDDDSPLHWTLELCSGCHYRVDKNNRKRVNQHYKKSNWFRTTKYPQYG